MIEHNLASPALRSAANRELSIRIEAVRVVRVAMRLVRRIAQAVLLVVRRTVGREGSDLHRKARTLRSPRRYTPAPDPRRCQQETRKTCGASSERAGIEMSLTCRHVVLIAVCVVIGMPVSAQARTHLSGVSKGAAGIRLSGCRSRRAKGNALPAIHRRADGWRARQRPRTSFEHYGTPSAAQFRSGRRWKTLAKSTTHRHRYSIPIRLTRVVTRLRVVAPQVTSQTSDCPPPEPRFGRSGWRPSQCSSRGPPPSSPASRPR